jgi:hypothetical protein
MKPLRNILLWALIVFAVIPSYAALDMFLKIEGNGFHTIIPLGCKDGTCKKGITKLEHFKAGTYTFTICNEKGDALKIEDKPMRKTASVRLTTQTTSRAYADAIIAKEMGTPMGDTTCMNCSPKVVIEKLVPAGSTFSETIQIAGDGVLLVDFSGVWSDGGIMFTDDWEPPVN